MKKLLCVIFTAVFALCALTSCSKDNVDALVGDKDNEFVESFDTDYVLAAFESKESDSNLTVIDAVVMSARLHAAFNETEVKERETVSEYRLDFDDPEILVDLTQRNSRNSHGVSFKRASGVIEDGALVCTAGEPNSNGSHDPQILLAGLEVQAKDYNKIKFRMKRDALPNVNDRKRSESVEIFFATNVSPGFAASKQININLPVNKELSEWFEAEFDLGNHAEWKDIITDVRFDPTNNNGVYYLDYIVFCKSDNIENTQWYDMYVDYALDNGLMAKKAFVSDEYDRGITREELFVLLAKALPSDCFVPINNIKGIPDISRYRKNADVFLEFYNSGITLGGDEKANFLPDSNIKLNEVKEIVDRIVVRENRLEGSFDCDWPEQADEFDVEFSDEKDVERITVDGLSGNVKDGSFVADVKNINPHIDIENIKFDAKDYLKLRVRLKADFKVMPEEAKYVFSFRGEGDNDFSTRKTVSGNFDEKTYVDADGWYIIEADFPTNYEWKGKIDGLRLSLPGVHAVYTLDYIRFVRNHPMFDASHNKLLRNGYVSHGMLQDIGFERGFFVQHYEQKNVNEEDRNWQYNVTEEKPTWDIGPWWCTYDLWENRDTTTDKYTLMDDKGINTITYNPEENSLSMRVNATKIYNGKPHDVKTYNWWPHLLLNQQYTKYPVDKEKNSANADRIFVELDMRITDYKSTINKEGANSCQFPLYLYFITDKAPTEKIWFGLSLMNGTSASPNTKPGWAPDSAAHQYMYSIPQATVYDGMLNSFNPAKGVLISNGSWKHIRVDITPHIDRCIEWANRDDAYGVEVTKDDMYFGGCNIGFEIHGNYDCTIEIKNLDIIAYNKAD